MLIKSVINKLFFIKFVLRILRPHSAVRLAVFGVRKTIFHEKTPALAIVALTFRCPCHCAHCSAGIYDRSMDEMDTGSWKKIIDQIRDLGIPRIHFTGGEPLLRKDTAELISYASRSGLIVFLETNGILLTPEVARQLKDAGVSSIDISLDSSQPPVHDSLRDYQGGFKKAVAAIKICRQYGIPTMVSTYASRRAIASGDLKDIFSLSRDLKVSAIRVLPPHPSGNWLKDYSVRLSVPEEKEVTKVMIASLPLLNRVKLPDCPINQMYTLYINPDGDVQPCAHLPFSFGNVRKEGLSGIVRRMSAHPMFAGKKLCFINNPQFREKYIDALPKDSKYPVRVGSP